MPWALVMSVKIDRAGEGARWMDAVVTRVHAGPSRLASSSLRSLFGGGC